MPSFETRSSIAPQDEGKKCSETKTNLHPEEQSEALRREGWRGKKGRAAKRNPTRQIGRVALVSVLIIAAVALLDRLAPPPLANAQDRAVVVADRHDDWLHAFATKDGRWRFTADIDAIDPEFIKRLIAVEDKRFYEHPGVDARALMRAAIDSARAGRIVSGGSTITMQTARLLQPRPRTLGSKAIEILRALQIERRLTKDEILELYLTLAPYGGNIEGVRAASLLYFGKEPAALSPHEQALLIALPQAPEARRPDRRPAAARAARNAILKKLTAIEALSASDAETAALAPTPASRRVFPRSAYHAARRAVIDARAQMAPGEPFSDDIRTTLDAATQTAAETLVRAHAAEAADAVNAAAVIVDAASGEIRASVGSAGFDRPGGWIDLTRAVRSPGSLLKPFVYGIAFDDGVLTLDAVMVDAPTSFGGYSPENFDRLYRGEVRVREALQHSLNIPAVAALQTIGARRFGAALENAGAPLVLPNKQNAKGAGLPTALGGAGLRLSDAAALYAGLLDKGRVKPLIMLRPETNAGESDKPTPYQIMSSQSAAAVLEALRTAPSLKGRAPSHLSRGAPMVAFKTGTSYGYRDAWAAGGADGLAVAVWTGRADGAPRPGETGRKAAAPLLFALFDALLDPQSDLRDSAPQDRAFASNSARAPAPVVQPLRIAFPTDGAELFSNETRGFALAAAGGEPPLRWYVNGESLSPREKGNARPLHASSPQWRPHAAGFYELAVVDATGASAMAAVRVRRQNAAP